MHLYNINFLKVHQYFQLFLELLYKKHFWIFLKINHIK